MIELRLYKCGLKTITREDLAGLNNLERLRIDHNNLRSIPSDLFADLKNLTRIGITENNLEFISSKLLDPIAGNDLKYAMFQGISEIKVLFQPSLAGVYNRFR
jgi:Leucine-rich repeat (LRR) protein